MNAAASVLMSVLEYDVEAVVLDVVLVSEFIIVDINVRVDVTVDVELKGDGTTVITPPFMYPVHE